MNKQGRNFKNFKKRYDLLISENMENREHDLKDVDELEKLNMVNLENKFNKKLNEYTQLYQTYLEELLTRQQSSMSSLKNKVISHNGEKYFVNDMNYKRKFTTDAWNSKSDTCSDPVRNINGETFNKLSVGRNMGIGEICRSGGYMAEDNAGTKAWVDVFGVKHFFDNINDIDESCKVSSVKLNQGFNAIPTGSKYSNADKCSKNKLDSSKWEK